ncbi:pancreatic lipase-related protein 2 [Pieris rapae]|uniref:pancreatic lipase-related protein 2 n=1 Tax=Pieris rapae TaxID=64459 RepID=UPI001E27DBDC|nr:pancreatic lipase-related protein 2 [Pieris rapae]
MLLKLLLVFCAFVECLTQSEYFDDNLGGSGSFNEYIAYTRASENGRVGIPFNATAESIEAVNFNSNLTTTFIVHGHQGTATTSLNPTVKDAILTVEEANVIIVDWSQYSLQSYENAVKAVPSVGTYLADMIQALLTANVTTLEQVHLVGFDLGAHVVGYAGRTLNGEVARITGLDPVQRSWGENTPRLNIKDAKYVEVIHTDTGGVFPNGIGTPLGHADFYPNGGGSQPGCLLHRPCCHNRAWEYFAASITHSHLQGNQCSSLLQMNLNRCRGFLHPMGNNGLSKLGSGIYRLNTRGTYPYLLTWF